MWKAPLWAGGVAVVFCFALAGAAFADGAFEDEHPLSNNNAHLLKIKEKLAAEAAAHPTPERERDEAGHFIVSPGDDFATALEIVNLPFTGFGNTCNLSNDYDASCAGGGAADVVYSYAPAVTQLVYLTLCSSLYDTQLSVFKDTPANEIACNDDYCGLQSRIDCIELEAGHTYYIVVDGFSTNCGEYELEVGICAGCDATCPYGAQIEGEPVCHEDYLDLYNGGCNSTPPVFTPLECAGYDKGIATLCGSAGTYLYGGLNYRDTDWYSICLEESTQVGACVTGEVSYQLSIIRAGDVDPCSGYELLATDYSDEACEAACADIYLGPGTYWIFVATQAFADVPCGSPYILQVRGCSSCGDCEADQPVLALGDVVTVGYTWPLWEVQVRLTNSGPGKAYSIYSEMGSDLAWLQIPDNTCFYGNLAQGEHSYGEPGDSSYVFDLTDWPGGSFNAWFDIVYVDSCNTTHLVHLDPDFIDPEQATGVTAGGVPIAETRLFPNRPNPFNPQTTISFEIPRAAYGEVAIFNAAGRLVRELWSGDLESGAHSFVWSGNDGGGTAVPSGAYFYRLRTDDFTETRRMLLIR